MVDLVALSGLVEDVEPDVLGSALTADASASDTVLPVASTEPFASETGVGSVIVNGVVYAQTEVDEDASTITISPGLASGADQDDQVNVSPISSNVVARVRTTDGDLLTARVSIHHIPYLRIGQRDPSQRETVTLYREGQGYVTLDVLNGTANTDANGLPMIPDEAVGTAANEVFLDGPPTHYLKVTDSTLVSYADMLAATGSDWAAAVSAVAFDNGTLNISPVGGAITIDSDHPYLPVWIVPTNGQQCRVAVEDGTQSPSSYGDVPGYSTYSENVTFDVEVYSSALEDAGPIDFFDYEYVLFDDTGSPGQLQRNFTYYTDTFPASQPTSLPADAVSWADTSNFQIAPLISQTPDEAYTTDVSVVVDSPWIGITIHQPIEQWEFAYDGPTPPPVFTLTGVRVIYT